MKNLLISLRTRVINELACLNGEQSVHVLSDEDLLPETTPYPCVGLRDGDSRTWYRTGSTDEFLNVDIIGYVQVLTPEGGILGTDRDTGILDLINDLKGALRQYDPPGYTWIMEEGALDEGASTTMARSDTLVQKKKFSQRWRKQTLL